jgi:hypothetical protein
MTNTTIIDKALNCRDLVADVVREKVGSVSKANEIDWTILGAEWVRVRVKGSKAKALLPKIHKELRDRFDGQVLCDPHDDSPLITTYRFKVS